MTDSTQSTRDLSGSTKSISAELSAANSAGKWMAWIGLGLAVLWWTGAIVSLLVLVGAQALASQPALLIIGVGALILLPGCLMLTAGFMARQSRRTSEANILLLKAADRLLAPARSATNEMASLAEGTRHATISINKTVTEAFRALKTLSESLAEERLRAESVGYAMADNARDLTRRLAEERVALETLARALDDQAQTLNEAIPRQATAMVEAAKAASLEVARADEGLEIRLNELKQAGSTLAVRLIDLDAVAKDAAQRSAALDASITQISEKLGRSHKTIEMAEQASAMAVEAAGTTADALKDAVSAALDSAREANQEIEHTTQGMRKAAGTAMAELREAGRQAVSSAQKISSEANAAPVQTDRSADTPQPRPDTPDVEIFGRDTSKAEDTGTNSSLLSDPLFDEPAQVAVRRRFTDPQQDTDQRNDDSLFDGASPEPAASANGALSDYASDPLELGAAGAPILLNQNANGKRTPQAERTPELRKTARPQSAEWRDIIADIGSEAAPVLAKPKAEIKTEFKTSTTEESAADKVLDWLESSGIGLPTVIRARDKKKIAAAKDHNARRTATRAVVGHQVSRVVRRLRQDQKLIQLARTFLSSEEAEALQALAATSRNGRHASPRLSAYLLLDAALTDTNPQIPGGS